MKRITRHYGTVGRTVFVVAIAIGLLTLVGGAGTAAAQTEIIGEEGDDALDETSVSITEEETISDVSEQETTEVEEETEVVTDETESSEDISVDPITPVTPETPPVPAIDSIDAFDT
ncbi:hypothetical protein [Natronorubrum sp. DTA7]|uniref:hypothetical protein n=1 Tax=Natronorubrum sp. DTA7 TaxID=3447016 RepID=UPI003F85A511